MCNCVQAAVMAAPEDANENCRRHRRTFEPHPPPPLHISCSFSPGELPVKIFASLQGSLKERQELKLSAAFRLHCISVSTQWAIEVCCERMARGKDIKR
uniref:MIP08075p n=1 Tax=Drosophila melanogaster TaxID=7227 RepID=C0PV46_DROME|nr:MIP08075p [Drosophila melanogaster]